MLKLVTFTVVWPFLDYFFGLFGVLFWDGSQGDDFEGLGGSWDGDFEGKGGIPKVTLTAFCQLVGVVLSLFGVLSWDGFQGTNLWCFWIDFSVSGVVLLRGKGGIPPVVPPLPLRGRLWHSMDPALGKNRAC